MSNEMTPTDYAQGRLAGRTYASPSFTIERENSSDYGQPARFIHRVFDPDGESVLEAEAERWVIKETEAGRYQYSLLVVREAGNVKELWVYRVPPEGDDSKMKTLLNLRQPEVGQLIELLRNLDYIPADGEENVRVDDSLLRDLFRNPNSVAAVYNQDPGYFAQLISDDVSARDVAAMASRRAAVDRFERLLHDSDFFDAEVARVGNGSPERVWQLLFEENHWLLGATLGTQVHYSWNSEKLEQVVAGFSIADGGKRTDALLRSSGRIRSMMFVEIKTHRLDLLEKEYRTGCWSPAEHLVGGVAQMQGTVHRAVTDIGERLQNTSGDGSDIPGDFTYLIKPRSVLVIGELSQLEGDSGGDDLKRVRSFELYRRSLLEPDVVTFDELLARARWVVGSPSTG